MRILCYGDSNTWGHDPKTGNRFAERWPKLLQQFCKEDEVIENGLCGRTAAFIDSVKPYRHGISSLRETLEIYQPLDLVILMLGTNDLKACFCADAISVSKGIEEMVQIIQNKAIYNVHMKVPKILLVSPIHIREGYDKVLRMQEQFNENSFRVSRRLACVYEEIAVQSGCEFLDASQVAEASEIDCIHMDANNHRRLAEAIYIKIKQ